MSETGYDALAGFFGLLERRGYEITVNDFSGLVVSDPVESGRMEPWFIHRNPFCMYVKADQGLWNECLRRKAGLCRAAGGRGSLFRGLCFCGREECIMPVAKDGILLATIGLGGFSRERAAGLERARRALGDRAGPAEQGRTLEELYDRSSAAPDLPDDEAQALLGLAAAELRRRYETLEARRGALVVPEAARLSRERRIALHAAEYLRRNFTRDIGVQDVAAACHVSRSTLSHLFRRSMGKSLSAYVSALRLEAAKGSLERGARVTDAAMESGFEDPNYFSRVFAEAEGVPPGRWAGRRRAGPVPGTRDAGRNAKPPAQDGRG